MKDVPATRADSNSTLVKEQGEPAK